MAEKFFVSHNFIADTKVVRVVTGGKKYCKSGGA